jgi:hypothetical protein
MSPLISICFTMKIKHRVIRGKAEEWEVGSGKTAVSWAHILDIRTQNEERKWPDADLFTSGMSA